MLTGKHYLVEDLDFLVSKIKNENGELKAYVFDLDKILPDNYYCGGIVVNEDRVEHRILIRKDWKK